MKWANLKNNKCPKCNASLSFQGKIIVCSKECGFKIREERMSEIVSSQVSGRIEREHETNQEALNEL